MKMEAESIEIKICMGSSCFARGNAEHLALLKKHALLASGRVRLTGSLCQEHCKQGPNLTVDGVSHKSVSTATLREILQRLENH